MLYKYDPKKTYITKKDFFSGRAYKKGEKFPKKGTIVTPFLMNRLLRTGWIEGKGDINSYREFRLQKEKKQKDSLEPLKESKKESE